MKNEPAGEVVEKAVYCSAGEACLGAKRSHLSSLGRSWRAQQPMIMPWQLTEQNRHLVLAELATFEAQTFVYDAVSHPPLARPFSAALRQATMAQLQAPMDPERIIWIASGRHGSLSVLLRAQVDERQEAWVDLLCAVGWAYNRRTQLYEGCGEFVLLGRLLEERGVTCFYMPFPLDAQQAGIQERWREHERGTYVHHSG